MEFGELLKDFFLDLQSLFRSRISKGSITLPQVLLISIIPDDGIDMSSLAKKLGVDNSTATRLVDKIIENQWVKRKKSKIDGRVTLIILTDKGEELQNEIESRIDTLGDEMEFIIPLENRDQYKNILSSFHWQVSKLLLKEQ
ncbi:MAG: MarR family transcriptional regulator [Candidatus Marinimicrobia bacterium]|jgi:DNA-binding MarR family transcriptional regulator|nr:MarR family transcriptional regulator [Candidatus Neomarinimicrobiota bacterium]MBT3617393.1 MarR family transcriptional regulator [Candidatus Neomarinimicrobiota bacterium]MBT3998291.1 MarR family transcriptional regulator [Candidatus Neomarinimicrobiota bacterium]MBT4281592.1 MarR family transcriptional regulator [Candidatus Neomarinimicrobiota bacterium]MBT4795810.1 MarR family transcriptional regulator [Candidatus Neomarinimicrobiota bacterium]